jgi:hypothetical protein
MHTDVYRLKKKPFPPSHSEENECESNNFVFFHGRRIFRA